MPKHYKEKYKAVLLSVYRRPKHQAHIRDMSNSDIRASSIIVGPELILGDIAALIEVGYDDIERVITEVLKVYPHLRSKVEQVRFQETITNA